MSNITIKQWGSSMGVVIPKPIARKLGLTPGTPVDITEREQTIYLRKAGRRPRRPIDKIVKQIKPGSYRALPGWDDVPPAGKEIW